MKFKLNEMLLTYKNVEFPLDAWDLYDELRNDYSDREIIEILVDYDFLSKDMLDKYDNDEVDMYDDVISVIDNMSKSEVQMIPQFEEVIQERIIPKIEDKLTLDIPYQVHGDWE